MSKPKNSNAAPKDSNRVTPHSLPLQGDQNIRLNCIDLFAGAGGFSIAAAISGFTVRLAIEYDKHAASTLRSNLSEYQAETCRVLSENITTINPQTALTDTFAPTETCHLVLGGPPCQGYSTHRLKDAGVSDERNALIYNYFSFVRTFRPYAFLMENVPGMLWSRHKSYLDKFYEEGAAAGYTLLDPVIVDARDYGVPQRRKRVFILGYSKDFQHDSLTWPPAPTHDRVGGSIAKPLLQPWLNCQQAFTPAPKDDINDVHMNHTHELVQAFAKTPQNGGSRNYSGRVLKCHEKHDGHKDVYGRIDPSKPAPTMTTACINPSKGRFVHPTENHGITVRQAARMQTFPDSYVFQGGLIAAGKQVGNAVPVLLAQHLLTTLHAALRSTLRRPAKPNEKSIAAE